MTATEELEKLIKDSGLKRGFIADYLGISRQALWKKIHNESYFNQYEIGKLCKLLKIKNLKQRKAIFFVEDVD